MRNQEVVSLVIIEPLAKDKDIHPGEKAAKNNEASDDFEEEDNPVLEVYSIDTLNTDTLHHVDYANDNGHFHFEGVLHKQDLACVQEPSGVKTKGINALVVFRSHVEVELTIGLVVTKFVIGILRAFHIDIVTRIEPPCRHSEPFVVKQTHVTGEETHQED